MSWNTENFISWSFLQAHPYFTPRAIYDEFFLMILFLMAPSFQNTNNYSSNLDLVWVQFLITSD